MKVLLVHARYELPGGEERMVDVIDNVLRARGHHVVRYEEENAQVRSGPTAAASIAWSRASRRRVAAVIARERPDVMHVHNHFPMITPSVYAAANDAGVPVVQHLHSARLVCIEPFMVRDGRACDDCVGRSPLSGVVHRCYRGSAVQSSAAAGIQMTHRALGTWRRRVTRYVAVSESLAATMRRSGVVPAERVAVCHNGLDAVWPERAASDDDGSVVFVGRLSYEKGVDLFVQAAAALPDVRFVVAGDGPERDLFARGAPDNVAFVGHVDRTGVHELMTRARVVVAPARGQEPFGLGVIEAAALGVPAIVADIGGLPEIVRDGESGIVVPPFAVDGIVTALQRLRDPSLARKLGAAARADFLNRFSPDAFADRLLAIYADVTNG